MSDYIKREDAIKIINQYIGADPIAERVEKDIPAADVEHVRHGRPKIVKRKQWVDDYKNLDGTLFECSKVLVEYEEDFCPLCGKALGDFDSYCGNCGARMDGEEKEHESN